MDSSVYPFPQGTIHSRLRNQLTIRRIQPASWPFEQPEVSVAVLQAREQGVLGLLIAGAVQCWRKMVNAHQELRVPTGADSVADERIVV